MISWVLGSSSTQLGTLTAVGGSLMPDDVLDTMREAGKVLCDLEELLRKSGRYVADLLGVDAALITSGAAAGLAVGVAAFMAGTDRAKIQQLPDTTGMKNEIVAQITSEQVRPSHSLSRCKAG